VAEAIGAEVPVAQFIGDKRILLVVDNFEHLIAAAPTVSEWLAACPRLRVIVTSREPLRVSGEQQYAVPPMSDADGPALFLTTPSYPRSAGGSTTFRSRSSSPPRGPRC
jgi:predicted ATPase